MSLRTSLPLFAVLVSSAAHAQFAVYGTITGERMSGITCLDPTGVCASTDGVVRPYGANFGGYYDFRNVGPVRLGLDVRGDVLKGDKSAEFYQASSGLIRHYDALGGVRASLATPIRYIRPYAEFAVGYAKTNAASAVAGTSVFNNYTEAKGIVGVDVPLLPYLDIRAIEFGGGALFGNGTHAIESIGAGLVFHTSTR